MAEPPFPDGSFDLVWSEGAVYNIGFPQGLKRWRRLLRTGGFIAVTEVSWLCEAPPREAVDYWRTEYSAMTSIEDNLTEVRLLSGKGRLRRCGATNPFSLWGEAVGDECVLKMSLVEKY